PGSLLRPNLEIKSYRRIGRDRGDARVQRRGAIAGRHWPQGGGRGGPPNQGDVQPVRRHRRVIGASRASRVDEPSAGCFLDLAEEGGPGEEALLPPACWPSGFPGARRCWLAPMPPRQT